MTEVSEQSPREEAPVIGGPGRHLREARESRKMTVEQAAAQLRMQARIIEALERDDYSSLPGNTFVRGYLRSYSRLLGLSEENIVALAQPDSVNEPMLLSSISQGKSEISSRDLPFRMMSFFILLVVVVGLGWWLSQREPGISSSTSPEIVQAGGEQGLLLPEEAVQQHDEVRSASPESENEATDNSSLEVKPVAEESDSATAAPSEKPVVEQQPLPVVSVVPVRVTPPELTDEMPQSLLEVEYQADSWSEISDAAGRKLVYGMIPAGNNLKLRGEAPFKVFLGYAAGVTVYYNGDLYDHSSYQRGDGVARFRIGRAEQNRPGSR